MHHPVITEEEMTPKMLEVGNAHFLVREADETFSKSGNPMVKLTLHVTDKKKNEGIVFDYLVGTENMAFKIKHFWESLGNPDQYATGDSPVDLMIAKTGTCRLKLDKSTDPKYSDRIVVADFLPREGDAIVDEDLPF